MQLYQYLFNFSNEAKCLNHLIGMSGNEVAKFEMIERWEA